MNSISYNDLLKTIRTQSKGKVDIVNDDGEIVKEMEFVGKTFTEKEKKVSERFFFLILEAEFKKGYAFEVNW